MADTFSFLKRAATTSKNIALRSLKGHSGHAVAMTPLSDAELRKELGYSTSSSTPPPSIAGVATGNSDKISFEYSKKAAEVVQLQNENVGIGLANRIARNIDPKNQELAFQQINKNFDVFIDEMVRVNKNFNNMQSAIRKTATSSSTAIKQITQNISTVDTRLSNLNRNVENLQREFQLLKATRDYKREYESSTPGLLAEKQKNNIYVMGQSNAESGIGSSVDKAIGAVAGAAGAAAVSGTGAASLAILRQRLAAVLGKLSKGRALGIIVRYLPSLGLRGAIGAISAATGIGTIVSVLMAASAVYMLYDLLAELEKAADEEGPASTANKYPGGPGAPGINPRGAPVPGLPAQGGMLTGFSAIAANIQTQDSSSQRTLPKSKLTFGEKFDRQMIEMQKSQFMKFGQLPPGFEFLPGHMGRLGQPAAVAARGAVPLGGDFAGMGAGGGYGGGGGGGGGGYTDAGGSTNAGGSTDQTAPVSTENAPLPSTLIEKARAVAATGGNQAVFDFMRQQGYPRSGAWCGQFAAAVVKSMGGTPPANPGIASNWRNYGVKVEGLPQPGDIAVQRYSRFGGGVVPTGETGSHVTFVDSVNAKGGKFLGLGGNQGKRISTFNLNKYDFYRMPVSATNPAPQPLPSDAKNAAQQDPNIAKTQNQASPRQQSSTQLNVRGSPIEGDASTYDPRFPGWKTGGMKTATGVPRNFEDFEAALQLDLAKKYKMGYGAGKVGYALVEHNGKKLIVRINDNGPLVKGRVIDLNSKAIQFFGEAGKNHGLLKGVKVTPLEGLNYTPGPVGEDFTGETKASDAPALGTGPKVFTGSQEYNKLVSSRGRPGFNVAQATQEFRVRSFTEEAMGLPTNVYGSQAVNVTQEAPTPAAQQTSTKVDGQVQSPVTMEKLAEQQKLIPPTGKNVGLPLPTTGTIGGQPLDPRPYRGGTHSAAAIDIAAPTGTPIISPAEGTVVKSYVSNSYAGKVLNIEVQGPDGNTYELRNYHLSGYAEGLSPKDIENARKSGKPLKIKAGQVIAYMGGTGRGGKTTFGSHLHVETHRVYYDKNGNRKTEKVNPNVVFGFGGKSSRGRKVETGQFYSEGQLGGNLMAGQLPQFPGMPTTPTLTAPPSTGDVIQMMAKGISGAQQVPGISVPSSTRLTGLSALASNVLPTETIPATQKIMPLAPQVSTGGMIGTPSGKSAIIEPDTKVPGVTIEKPKETPSPLPNDLGIKGEAIQPGFEAVTPQEPPPPSEPVENPVDTAIESGAAAGDKDMQNMLKTKEEESQERTGATGPNQGSSGPSNGGKYNPESQSAEPGSGGYGSYGRCFV